MSAPAVKLGWPTRALLLPIRIYRRYLSPLKMRPTCRYLPTCSEYAAQAITARGPLVGLGLALSRFLRCNPLFHGGYHPVTQAGCSCSEKGH